MQEPYDINRERIILQARAILQDNQKKFFVWAAVYMLLLYGPSIAALTVQPMMEGPGLILLRAALMPALIGMYGWLRDILYKKEYACRGLLKPFRWIKTRSAARFAGLVAAVAGAAYLLMSIANGIVRLVATRVLLSMPVSSVTYVSWFLVPVLSVPTWLLFQWMVEFYCIHAVQTDGRKAFGIIGTQSAIFGDTVRIQARLMARTLWIPYALYFSFAALTVPFQELAAWMPFLAAFMAFAFLGFGFYYYPLSAIARYLLILEQPRNILVPEEEPLDFSQADALYESIRLEREAYRQRKAATREEKKGDGDEDEA